MNGLIVKKMSRIVTWMMAGVSAVWMIVPAQIVSAADTYHYRWISQTPATVSADGKAHIVNANAGDTVALSVTLQNMSNTAIRGKSSLGAAPAGKQVPVGSYAIGVRGDVQTPWLDASSFVLNGNRMAYYEGPDVAPNAQFTISWNVRVASSIANGSYDLYFRPVYEYKSWTAQIAWNGKLLAFDSADIFTRFIIGGGSTVLTDVTETGVGLSVGQTTYDGARTSYFKDSSGGIGYPMIRTQALSLDRELRRIESGASSYANDTQEFIWNDSYGIINNPLNGQEVIFSTVDGYYGDILNRVGATIITRVYGYNTQTRQLRKLYESVPIPALQSGGSYYEILGTYGNSLILRKDAPESSPGPCYNFWLNSGQLYTFDLANPTQLIAWQAPAWKITQEQTKQQACENDAGI